MTENNKQERHLDDAVEATFTASKNAENHLNQSKKQSNQFTQSTSLTKLFTTVSVGFSAIAIATSGWLYFQNTQSTVKQDIEQVTIQQMNLGKKINASTLNQSQLNQLIEQVKQSEQTIQTQENQLLAHQSQQSEKLLSLESKLNRLSSTTKEDWKLAEAEYLIRLANQRLLLESDNSGAATLLSNADDILNELEDPIVFTTRKALAKDIQALKSISPFDLEGAYLKLNALYDSVQTLPQREPSKEWQANTTAEPITSTTTGQLTSALESFWQSLRSLVVINYNHKPIKALLPPAEYQELITGLQLQLEIAQIALIKGEPIIYQAALSRVANAITAHFETQSSSVISFLASLTALQQLNPSPDLPLPRESLMAMKSLMKKWTNRGDNTPIETGTSTTEQAPAKKENLDIPKTELGDDL